MPQIVIVAAVFSFVLVIVLMLFLFINTRRRSSTSAGLSPATQAMVADARYDPGERPASLVSEQIEEVVKGKLKQYPDLTNG